MNKLILTLGTLALVGFTAPVSAQMMCGSGQQAQASGQGGMMCGMMGAAQPKSEGEAQKPQQSSMCPCCRNMAMMRGGGGMQHHNMPGTETPKQQ
jgi:hypothetical protein